MLRDIIFIIPHISYLKKKSKHRLSSFYIYDFQNNFL